MKKIIIILLILALGIASVYAQEAQGSQDNQGGEEYIAPKKNTFWGFSINFGLSRLSIPDNVTTIKSTSPGFDWGLHLNASFYISGSPIGLNFSIGIERLSGTFNYYSGQELTMKSTLIPIHLSLAVRSGGIFVNAGLSIAAQPKLTATSATLSMVANDARTPLTGIYINLGYRVALGRMYIPIGLEFTYYFTNIAESTQGDKWLQLNLKVGIEF